MYLHFQDQYGSFIPGEEIIQQLANTENRQERVWIFTEYLSLAGSPYELFGIVFNNWFKEYIDGAAAIALDYIVEHREKWEEDELACFLLQVLDDHVTLGMSTEWIKKAKCANILKLTHASEFIWELFWLNSHPMLVMEIINHYKLNTEFAKVIEEQAEAEETNKDLYYVAARMAEAGVLDQAPERSSAADYIQAINLFKSNEAAKAIPLLLDFHDRFPQIIAQRVRIDLARCYIAIGWRGNALDWVIEALAEDPDNTEAKTIEKQIREIDRDLLEEVERFVRGTHSWTAGSIEALVQAEFLYQYHGRMLREHGFIISSYARAVEIQLRDRLLPKLRDWIKNSGKEIGGKRYIRVSKKEKGMSADEEEKRITLGTWSLLFNEPDPRQLREKPGEFYNCLHIAYGGTIWLKELSEFGSQLNELTKLRNAASHGSISDWNKVRRARELALGVISKLKTTTSSIA